MSGPRLGVQRLPVVRGLERTSAPAPRRPGRGIAVGDNGRGAFVLLDVKRGIVCAWDPATDARSDEVQVPCGQDPLTPGLVSVDDSGRRALVMSARSMHADASLMLVDLDGKTAREVASLDGAGWLVGAFGPRGIVVCEQVLADVPRHSVLWNGKRVWSVDGMQQPCVPAFVGDDVLALVVCPSPSSVTWTGPPSLCALDLVSGTLAPLTPAEGERVRKDGEVIVVEGGTEIVRVQI